MTKAELIAEIKSRLGGNSNNSYAVVVELVDAEELTKAVNMAMREFNRRIPKRVYRSLACPTGEHTFELIGQGSKAWAHLLQNKVKITSDLYGTAPYMRKIQIVSDTALSVDFQEESCIIKIVPGTTTSLTLTNAINGASVNKWFSAEDIGSAVTLTASDLVDEIPFAGLFSFTLGDERGAPRGLLEVQPLKDETRPAGAFSSFLGVPIPINYLTGGDIYDVMQWNEMRSRIFDAEFDWELEESSMTFIAYNGTGKQIRCGLCLAFDHRFVSELTNDYVNWVLRFAENQCKFPLSRILQKYKNVPLPGGATFTSDGDELRREAIDDEKTLKEGLDGMMAIPAPEYY